MLLPSKMEVNQGIVWIQSQDALILDYGVVNLAQRPRFWPLLYARKVCFMLGKEPGFVSKMNSLT